MDCKRKKICSTLVLLFVCWVSAALLNGCGGNDVQNETLVGGASEQQRQLAPQDILAHIRKSADIVTTEVTVRKIALYDTSKSERFSWKNPSTWKYGERKCIIPIEVHIKYGYDLAELDIDDIRLTDDSTAVVVLLPKPKIIDASYNTYIDEGSVVSISTGLRSEIGHALEEEIRRKGYEAVLKEDLTGVIGDDVKRNAQILFDSIIRSLGFKSATVITLENVK